MCQLWKATVKREGIVRSELEGLTLFQSEKMNLSSHLNTNFFAPQFNSKRPKFVTYVVLVGKINLAIFKTKQVKDYSLSQTKTV